MMKVLVTGGGGFLGSVLVNLLAKRKDIEISILDTFVHGFPKDFVKKKKIQNPVVGNIRNYYDIYHLVDRFRPDVVYHLAAYITRPENIGDFKLCAEVNYVGTANLIDACARLKGEVPKKIIYASCESARDPLSHIGIAKKASESLLELTCPDLGMSIATLRLAEIYGYSSVYTSSGVINFLIDNLILNKNIHLFGPKAVKDHLHVDDAARALVSLLDLDFSKISGIDVGTGVGVSMMELAQALKELCDSKTVFKFSDSPLIRVVSSVSDPEPAKEILGFETQVNFEEAVIKQISKRKKDLK